MRVALHNRRASMAVSRAIPQLVNAEAACMYDTSDTSDTYMTSIRHRMACCQDYSLQILFDLLPPRFFVQQRPELPVKMITKEPTPNLSRRNRTCTRMRVHICAIIATSPSVPFRQRHFILFSDLDGTP